MLVEQSPAELAEGDIAKDVPFIFAVDLSASNMKYEPGLLRNPSINASGDGFIPGHHDKREADVIERQLL
jgi:hypothetical protein